MSDASEKALRRRPGRPRASSHRDIGLHGVKTFSTLVRLAQKKSRLANMQVHVIFDAACELEGITTNGPNVELGALWLLVR